MPPKVFHSDPRIEGGRSRNKNPAIGCPSARLQRLIRAIANLSARADLSALKQCVSASELTIDDVQPFVRFDTGCYQRVTLATGGDNPGFEVLVLGWRPGQFSPIHNHRGSGCCVKILQGIGLETTYAPHGDDGSFITQSTWRETGDVFAGEDDDTHSLGNAASAEIGLVSLHVYRPRLTRMELFAIRRGRLRRGN
ncbi:MAG: cysteine dioxygenase family protein [Planctomycetota bacterium]